MARVILIEPDRVLAEQCSAALTRAGHEVVPCASAQAAVIAADQAPPDVVVMEVQLIGHSGIEFLCEFRSYSEWQDVPVIIHSLVPPGEFAGNEKLLREQLGVAEYLYKPSASLQRLCASVAAILPVAVAI